MNKNFYFKFRYREFSSQTRFYDDSAIGMLMRILCAQAEYGSLPINQINILKAGNPDDWEQIKTRFKQDANGLFYDEWLSDILIDKKTISNKLLDNFGGKMAYPQKDSPNE